MKKGIRNSVRVIGLLLAVILLQSCADNRPAEEIVHERAQERLDLLMEANVEEAYEKYTTDTYKELTGLMHYYSRVGGISMWTSAKVTEVSCASEDICQVKTMISYEFKESKVKNVIRIDEKWLKINGAWFLYNK